MSSSTDTTAPATEIAKQTNAGCNHPCIPDPSCSSSRHEVACTPPVLPMLGLGRIPFRQASEEGV